MHTSNNMIKYYCLVSFKQVLPSINENDVSITDLLYGILGNSFSSKNDLLINVALDTVQQFSLCLRTDERECETVDEMETENQCI